MLDLLLTVDDVLDLFDEVGAGPAHEPCSHLHVFELTVNLHKVHLVHELLHLYLGVRRVSGSEECLDCSVSQLTITRVLLVYSDLARAPFHLRNQVLYDIVHIIGWLDGSQNYLQLGYFVVDGHLHLIQEFLY